MSILPPLGHCCLFAMPCLFENHQSRPSVYWHWTFSCFAAVLAADFLSRRLTFVPHKHCSIYVWPSMALWIKKKKLKDNRECPASSKPKVSGITGNIRFKPVSVGMSQLCVLFLILIQVLNSKFFANSIKTCTAYCGVSFTMRLTDFWAVCIPRILLIAVKIKIKMASRRKVSRLVLCSEWAKIRYVGMYR